jgi:hypothetical protein
MLASRVQIGDSVIFQQLNNEAVLLNMITQQYFGLNEVGSEMWKLLIQLGDPREVLQRLQATYAAPPEAIERDLDVLMRELLKEGLLVTARNSSND